MRGIKDKIMLDEGGFNYGNFKQGIWVKTALWYTASVVFFGLVAIVLVCFAARQKKFLNQSDWIVNHFDLGINSKNQFHII